MDLQIVLSLVFAAAMFLYLCRALIYPEDF